MFRMFLIVGFLVVLSTTLYHRLQSRTGEKLDRLQEGLFSLIALRLVGLTLLIAIVSYLVNPQSMAWSSVDAPAWMRCIGAAVFAAATLLLFWTLRGLGPNLTDTVVTRERHTLVTRGPYRWVRHPFYDAVALLIVGTAVAAGNWFIFLAGAVLFMFFAARVRIEEANLLKRFGEPYREYRSRTGRFVPRAIARLRWGRP